MFSEEFKKSFENSNQRLKQPLLIKHLESAIRYLASKNYNCCISIQPGHSGYAYSDRKVLMVFLWNTGDKIRVRYLKRISHHNSEISPGCFKELRGFPKGKILEKLNKWSDEKDGASLNLSDIQKLERLPSDFYSSDSETNKLVYYREFNFK